MKKLLGAAISAAAIITAPVVARAADFDGSKALICATMEAHDCSAGETCLRVLPQSVGVPKFMRINFANKTVAGPKRTTPILHMEKGDNHILLLGTELGFAWALALNMEDGSLAETVVTRDSAVALFGACTPL